MSGVFDSTYADAYNIVYKNKDYAGECAVFDKLIAQYGDGAVKKILDLGCGTGRHAMAFHDMGYAVRGVDRSAAMLAHARMVATERAIPAQFDEGDARSYRCNDRFDATLMMFNVLGYMSTLDDVMAALTTARHHTRPGGLIIADIWYGPAVAKDGPGNQFKEYTDGDDRLFRFASGRVNTLEQICEIDIRVLKVTGDKVVADTLENHRMRYFFPAELELALRLNGFKLLALQGFPDIEQPVSDDKWLCVMVGQATGIPT